MEIARAGVSSTIIVVALVAVIAIAAAGYLLAGGGRSGVSPTGTQTRISLQFTTSLHIQAGGSSFVGPIMNTWTYQFLNRTNSQVTIDYGTQGSAAGISELFGGLLDYAGSDIPVSSSYLAANSSGRSLLQIPEALGSVAIFYNLPGVTRHLNLTGSALVGIYSQAITMWNDPTLVALNRGTVLPAHVIVPVHRSDGSGTTYALSTYFSKVDSTWAKEHGAGVVINWPNSPNSELGGRGSGGVAGIVNETAYSIGYADSFYATANGLTTAAIQNSDGNLVLPSVAGASAAAAAFANQINANVTYPIMNAPGHDSYPIATFTYLLVFKDQNNSEKADAITAFFWWVVHDGQTYSPRLFFAPLPTSVVTIDESLIRQINYNGQSYAPSP